MSPSRLATCLGTCACVLLGAGAAEARGPGSAAQVVQSTLLRHGAITMQLILTPEPRLLGAGTDLVATPGRLAGYVQDGRYDVAITADRAVGRGPRGDVALELIARGEHALAVKGLWNGEKVDLLFSDAGITGRMVHHVSGGAREVQSCRVAVDQRKGPLVLGEVRCLGQQVPLAYVVEPAPLMHMHRSEVALLLLTYFSSAPSPPPVS